MNIQKNNRVYTSVVIPDYSKQCLLEIDRKELEESYKMIRSHPPFLKCLVSKEYFKEMDHNQKLRQIDHMIDKELIRPYVGTKTAFMSLESLESIARLKGELE